MWKTVEETQLITDAELNSVHGFSVSHSESEGEVQDNRPSIDFSDLDDDSEEEF